MPSPYDTPPSDLEFLREGSDEKGKYKLYRDWSQGGADVRKYEGMAMPTRDPGTVETQADKMVTTVRTPEGGTAIVYQRPSGEQYSKPVASTYKPPAPQPPAAPAGPSAPRAPAPNPQPPAGAPPAGPPRELGPEEILSLSPDQLAEYERRRAVWKAYAPAQYATIGRDVPAHAEPAGWQIQQRTPIDEETAKALDDATRERAKAEAEMQRLNAAQIEEQAAAQELEAEQVDWDLKQEQARMVEVRQKMDQAIAQWDAESRAVREQKVDPGRWWHSLNAGGKIAVIIGAMLGGDQGGSKMIDDFQNRDIELQLGEIERRERGLSDRRVALDDMLERYGDQRAAVAALKDRQLGVAAQRAEAMKMRAQSEQQRAGIDLFLKQVDEKRAALKVEWAQANAPVVNASVRWIPEQQAQTVKVGGGGGVDAALAAAGTGGATTVPGMSDRELATERSKLLERIRTREEALASFDAASKDYIRFTNTPPKDAEERAQARLPTQLMRAAVWNGLQGRKDAPSAAEVESLQAVVPDPFGYAETTAAAYGIGGARKRRSGIVTSVQTARARIKAQLDADKARLSSLPVTGSAPNPQPATEASGK